MSAGEPREKCPLALVSIAARYPSTTEDRVAAAARLRIRS